jgi:hypothetical protein
MPYQPVPGARGVNMLPGGETDPEILETIQLKDGTTMVRTKKSGWVKALPYAIAAGMAGPHIAGLLGAGGAAGGGASAAQGGAGVLPSYGASPAMMAAGAGLPSVAANTPSAALGALGGGAANALTGGGGSLLGKILTGLKDYAGLGLAGVSAARGLTQGPTAAEKQLEEIMNLAKGRVQASEPLFNMLNTMAQAQMPKYTRGEE